MVKRWFDILFSIAALVALSPILLTVTLLIWLQDLDSPFYLGQRVGRQGGRVFRMAKFRSMVADAERFGARSTALDDQRITAVGRLVRRSKLDEVPQLWNVLAGDMSLVGPRPNVPAEVALYSKEERGLLAVRPGLTDFASIVFADEGEILRGSCDPDRAYNLLIRPWKSRLGLHYVRVQSLAVDVGLLVWTAIALVSRQTALRGVQRLLVRTGAAADLVQVAGRSVALVPTPPPGVAEAEWQRYVVGA